MNGDWGDHFWFPHTVTARAFQGAGGRGPQYADPVELAAEVLDKTERIRDAQGVETVSSSRVTVPVSADVPVGSLVTVRPGRPNARASEVLKAEIVEDDPPLPSHIVLWLK